MPSYRFDPTSFTWGFELEVGDVQRGVTIPSKFGVWEFSETDVVNVLPPYQYIACDPLGIRPPVGGEVNMVPTHSWSDQVELIDGLLSWFKQSGQTPTTNCISHTHVHVHVPGLIGNLSGLKRLTRYIINNQQVCLKRIHQFDESKLHGSRIGRTYLKWDCGRPMPEWMGENIVYHAKTFDDFIRIQCCGKDAKSMGRPFRYMINTYCLKHTQTIEFRLFRGSVAISEIADCFRFVEEFVTAALNNGASVEDILDAGSYKFPPFRYNLKEVEGWNNTKWGKERGKKQRKYIHI